MYNRCALSTQAKLNSLYFIKEGMEHQIHQLNDVLSNIDRRRRKRPKFSAPLLRTMIALCLLYANIVQNKLSGDFPNEMRAQQYHPVRELSRTVATPFAQAPTALRRGLKRVGGPSCSALSLQIRIDLSLSSHHESVW